MTTETLNAQLASIYQTYTDSIYAKEWEDNVSAPLLMHVYDEYVTMDRKILFVGQETHSWGQMNLKPTVSELLTNYRNFNLGKSADYRDGKPLRYLRSPFWNFNRSIFHRCNSHNPTVTRNTNGFLWTNISKFDCNSTTPSTDLQDRNAEGFALLKAEIAILKPDIVVFLTGPNMMGVLMQYLIRNGKPSCPTVICTGFQRAMVRCRFIRFRPSIRGHCWVLAGISCRIGIGRYWGKLLNVL